MNAHKKADRDEERAAIQRRLDVLNAEETLENADWCDLCEHVTDAIYNAPSMGFQKSPTHLGDLLVALRENAIDLPEPVHTRWVALFDYTAERLADEFDRERKRPSIITTEIRVAR